LPHFAQSYLQQTQSLRQDLAKRELQQAAVAQAQSNRNQVGVKEGQPFAITGTQNPTMNSPNKQPDNSAQNPTAGATAASNAAAIAGPPQSTPTARGPFGFKRGMTREQIISLVGKSAIDSKNSEDDVLVIRRAPVSDPGFEEYSLVISRKEGLLKVTAIGVSVKTDSFGTQLRELYRNTVAAVSRKYGETKGKADGCIMHPKNAGEAHFGCLYPDSYLLDLKNGAPVGRVWNESLKAKGGSLDGVVYIHVEPQLEDIKFFDPRIAASVYRATGVTVESALAYVTVEYAFEGFDEYLVSSGQAPNPTTVPATIPYGAIQ